MWESIFDSFDLHNLSFIYFIESDLNIFQSKLRLCLQVSFLNLEVELFVSDLPDDGSIESHSFLCSTEIRCICWIGKKSSFASLKDGWQNLNSYSFRSSIAKFCSIWNRSRDFLIYFIRQICSIIPHRRSLPQIYIMAYSIQMWGGSHFPTLTGCSWPIRN